MTSPQTRPVALVTAAADGIGSATAQAFAALDYRVVLVDIDDDGARRTAAGLHPDAAQVFVGDVTVEADTLAARDRALEAFGRIDALANVVGGSRPGKTAVELSIEEWNRLLALNLTSVYLMSRAVLPSMRTAGQGAIVNVSSGAGLHGMRKNPGYVAAKAGVAALTRAMAIDHGPDGIRVNCVAPGPIRTPLMRRNRTPEEIAAMGALAIAGRIGEPEEVAAAIVWLAGPGASYIQGQTLEVDGGMAAPV